MLLTRQKVILDFLRELGGSSTRLQLTKLLFLTRQETASAGGSAFYDFLPYQYGPFSFLMYHDLRNLVRDGLVREAGDRTVELTDAGGLLPLTLPGQVELDVRRVSRRYGQMSGGDLLHDVYARYPWFTLLAINEQRRSLDRPVAEPAVYSIGYEGYQIDGFLNRLLEVGIARLIDVRSNPVARRYGFHKSTLSRLCADVGIDYAHLPELGIRSELRSHLETGEDFEGLFGWYGSSLVNEDLEDLAFQMRSKPSALMCMEALAKDCHRSVLAKAVAPVVGLPVCHLERA